MQSERQLRIRIKTEVGNAACPHVGVLIRKVFAVSKELRICQDYFDRPAIGGGDASDEFRIDGRAASYKSQCLAHELGGERRGGEVPLLWAVLTEPPVRTLNLAPEIQRRLESQAQGR